MRTSAWIVLLLLLAVIGCRSNAKKTEEDTSRTPVAEVTPEVVPPVAESAEETPSTIVEIAPPVVPIEVLPEVPLTPEEEAVVAELEARIVELERALADGKQELRETLARLRGNREKKLSRMRTELHTAIEDFDRGLEEARIVRGGEHHGE